MKASAFTSRFSRKPPEAAATASDAPVAAAADVPAGPVDTPVAAAAADKPAAEPPETPSAPAAPPRGSRLIEGARFRSAHPAAAMTALRERAVAAAARLKPASVPMAAAAAIVLALGAGYGVGASSFRTDAARWGEATNEVRKANREVARIASELDAVKGSLDALKGGRDTTRTDARQAQLLEKLERAGQETSVRIGRMAEQIDRIEKTQRDPARLAALGEKLDRIEKTVASAPPLPPAKPAATASAPVPDVKETGSIGEAKPAKAEPADPRKMPIEGFYVRDYDDGFALIETKAGRYIEVAVGYTVPGVGRVEAIERRGRQWVVQTTKGFIGER